MAFGKRYKSANEKYEESVQSMADWAGLSMGMATVSGLNGALHKEHPAAPALLASAGVSTLGTALLYLLSPSRPKPPKDLSDS
jgi:hypothetical protein